jgi:N-acetylmuramoyl-L-alanine amidase
MSTTLRSLAVASCTAIVVAGATTVAAASGAPAPAFTLRPAFGQTNSTVTLTASSGTDFTGETAVTINGTAVLPSSLHVTSHKITAVVPSATSGPVVVHGAHTFTGPNFTIQQATAGNTSLSTSQLTFTHPLLVTAALTVAANGHPVAGQLAELQHRVSGTKTWSHASATVGKKTGPRGAVHWRVRPSASGAFRVHFRETAAYASLTTSGQAVRVGPRLHLKPIHTVPTRTTTQLDGTIRPHLSGVVYLQRFSKGAWRAAGHSTLFDGRYSFSISPSVLGTLSYRAVWRSDGTHAHSTTRSLHVLVVNRDLFIGDSGSDVRQLQKRLHKLHYDIGTINGDFGDDTLHAVTAFEKVQGFTPDGEVSTKVWKALNHPKRIKLRHPTAGTYEVEVNIGKQVLLMAKNGHIVHILDTSTAGGYAYTNSEGGTSIAITPTGHFNIQYKLTGTRVSKLGTLYYPSYFTNTGYAIHGEGNGNDGGEVPPFPNSHGCVRITDNAVLRYFSTPYLAVGTSVWIYH